jgi:predicted nucleic acid-binding protein
VIIDANVAHEVFSNPPTKRGRQLLDRVARGRCRIIFGGKLTNELARVGQAQRLLAELKASGKAFELRGESINAELDKVEELGICRSNDLHIIALARASGARVLFSHDRRLRADFTNRDVLVPRGKVYQSAAQRHLLICKK